MKKIYILTNTLKNGGAEKQSVLLAKVLKDKYKVKLIVYYGYQCDEKLLKFTYNNQIDVLFLKGNYLLKAYVLYRIFKRNPDSVIFSYLATTNIINAVIGLIAGVRWRIGGIRSSKLSKVKFLLQRFLHNHMLSYSIINNYSGFEEFTERYFNINKISVIPNGLEIKEPPHFSRANGGTINILSVSRFVPQKDYRTAFDAIVILNSKITQRIKYMIVGYGPMEAELRASVKELNLDDYVEFIINPKNVSSYYKKADIYLSTSYFEGLSNSIMEAMEYSLPIVATDVGDNNKLVLNGFNGYLSPVKSPEVLAEKITLLIKNKEKRNKMGINSYSHLKENYSLNTFQKRYIDLLEKFTNFHEQKT